MTRVPLNACGDDSVWYHYPSLMVNATGHMVAGFSGSSSNIFISAFYAWRLAGGAVAERPGLLKEGEGYFYDDRWGDYSYTTLDPVDSLTFWTVQEYARPHGVLPADERWGTWINEIER